MIRVLQKNSLGGRRETQRIRSGCFWAEGLFLAPGAPGAGPELQEACEEVSRNQDWICLAVPWELLTVWPKVGLELCLTTPRASQPPKKDLMKKLNQPHPGLALASDSLHVVSDSSEPSGHSSSPSHFHRSGMQWPLPQVKSLSAQVFLAVGQGEEHEGAWRAKSAFLGYSQVALGRPG